MKTKLTVELGIAAAYDYGDSGTWYVHITEIDWDERNFEGNEQEILDKAKAVSLEQIDGSIYVWLHWVGYEEDEWGEEE